jgi:hypothetical protein
MAGRTTGTGRAVGVFLRPITILLPCAQEPQANLHRLVFAVEYPLPNDEVIRPNCCVALREGLLISGDNS